MTSSFPDGKFFVFPTSVSEFVFEIGGKQHAVRIPLEFADQMDKIGQKVLRVSTICSLCSRSFLGSGFSGQKIKLTDRTYKNGDVAFGL